MSSDVCKHCTSAACLEVCPTGALFRTEFGTVVVQQDICNGCGYCIPACPYGVIDRREEDGRAHKCTLCYDRLKDDMTPGVREGVPDGVDPVRAAGRDARARLRAPGGAARRRRVERAAVRRGPRRRRRRRRARSSCSSTSPRSTACRPIRSRPRATWARCGARRRARARRCWPGSRWRASAAGGEPTPDYYGRPILKAPVWTWEIPAYFFFGGMAGRGRALRAAQRAARRRGARAARVAGRAGRRRGEPAAADRRPRAPRALPPHAARAQADLADERRLLGPRRQQHRDRPRERAQPVRLVPAPGARGGRHRRPRPGAVDLHRRARGRHRDPRVARGAPRAALRVRRRRGDERGVGGRARRRRRRPRGGWRWWARRASWPRRPRWSAASGPSASPTARARAGPLRPRGQGADRGGRPA